MNNYELGTKENSDRMFNPYQPESELNMQGKSPRSHSNFSGFDPSENMSRSHSKSHHIKEAPLNNTRKTPVQYRNGDTYLGGLNAQN